MAADDVNTTDPPEQKVVGPPAVIAGAAGSGFTVTAEEAEGEVQPLAETVNVYVPLAVTVMDCVTAPVDQVLPVAEDDVKVTEPPEQKVVGPLAVIVGVAGTGVTVTTVAAEVEEQDPLKTVTV